MTWTNCSNSQTDWRRFANNCWWIYKHKQIADTLQKIWATWLYPGYILHQSKVAEHLCDFAVNHFPGLISVSKATRFWIFYDVSCLSKFLFNVNLRVQQLIYNFDQFDDKQLVNHHINQQIGNVNLFVQTLVAGCLHLIAVLSPFWCTLLDLSTAPAGSRRAGSCFWSKHFKGS